jgi:hypothetical protein
MKLSHILEARYAFPKYVQWVVDSLEKGGGEKSLEGIPKDDTQIVLDQITKQFGKPHYLEFAGEEERNYYLWQNHAGGPVSYDIAFWPDWGELLVHRIRGVPVNEVAQQWAPIRNWPKYEVSDAGNVRIAATKQNVAQWEHTGKITTYLRVTLRDQGKRWNPRVHRLVADAFVEKPEGATQVDHLDHNPFNNAADNLEWVTGEENIRRRQAHLGEARIAQHSIIDDIKHAIANRDPWEQLINDATYEEIVSLLTREFGEPFSANRILHGLTKKVWRYDREEIAAVKYPDGYSEVYLV